MPLPLCSIITIVCYAFDNKSTRLLNTVLRKNPGLVTCGIQVIIILASRRDGPKQCRAGQKFVPEFIYKGLVS